MFFTYDYTLLLKADSSQTNQLMNCKIDNRFSRVNAQQIIRNTIKTSIGDTYNLNGRISSVGVFSIIEPMATIILNCNGPAVHHHK